MLYLYKERKLMNYNISKEFLLKEYIEHKKTCQQTGKLIGCSKSTISKNLKKYNISSRPLKEAKRQYNISKSFLFEEYLKNKKSTSQIAKILKCSHGVIQKALERYNIKTRSIKESQKGLNKGNKNHFYKDNRTNKQYRCKDCKKQITIASALYGAGRCSHCSKVGELSNHWQNGKSFEEYPREFNKRLKLKIRTRDNFTCQKCDITEEEHLTVYGRVLDCHHIDYNKKNCNEENLIALCNECNLRVNFNRKYWKKYFKGDLKCSV